MLSRLKNKFRRVSQGGASSNLDVNHMTSARSCDDVTRLDESNQLTYTEAIDTGVERRQRKVGRSAVGENGRWSDAIPGGVEKSLRGKRGSEESVTKERRRDRFRRLYHMYIRPRGAVYDNEARRGSEPKRQSNLSSSDSDSDSSSESSVNEDLDERFEIMQRESVARRSSQVALRENSLCIEEKVEEAENGYGKVEPARNFVEAEKEVKITGELLGEAVEENRAGQQEKSEANNIRTSQPSAADSDGSRKSAAKTSRTSSLGFNFGRKNSSASDVGAATSVATKKTSTCKSPLNASASSNKNGSRQSTVVMKSASQKSDSTQSPAASNRSSQKNSTSKTPAIVNPVSQKSSETQSPFVGTPSIVTKPPSADVRMSVGGNSNSKRTSVASVVWDNTVADMMSCTSESRKLTSFIFVYNECTNRHWEWAKMPFEKRMKTDEPDWDEFWQPTQPDIVTIIGKTVKSQGQNPKQKLHTVSRQFNFFENPLDQVDGSASESEKSVSESCGGQDTPRVTSKEIHLSKSHHAMTRIGGVPWKKNVLNGSYRKRRDISLLQVELMIAETDSYPGSDEAVLQTKRARKKSSVAKRKSTVMPALLENVQAENVSEIDETDGDASALVRPSMDGLGIRRGNVARLIQEFKNDSSRIENSLAMKMNGDTCDLKREPKIECLAKTSLIFKGNGKFESIIMAGQTGAANEETLALGGPVEIVAKREFFVNVSLIYVFSAETLKEETIEMKSQGQKEVENLGMNRFGSDLVSRMIAQYTQMEDERTGSRNQVPEILTEQKMDENEKKTRRVQETFRKRQEAELLKCIWSSRMRHFRDSLTEIVGAKFIPENITAVVPEETSEEDFMSIKKYMRLELFACAGKNSSLPKNWPRSDTINVVSSLIALSHSELEQIVLE